MAGDCMNAVPLQILTKQTEDYIEKPEEKDRRKEYEKKIDELV